MSFKIKVNQKTCIGCGSCSAICPESFEMQGDKAKEKKSKIEEITCEEDAKIACPTDSITVEKI